MRVLSVGEVMELLVFARNTSRKDTATCSPPSILIDSKEMFMFMTR